MDLDPASVGLAAAAAGVLLVSIVFSIRFATRRRSGLFFGPAAAFLLAVLAFLLVLARPQVPSLALTGQLVVLATAMGLCAQTIWLGREPAGEPWTATDAATVDLLTRVASHRAFQDRLAHECERAYRFGDTFVLIMLDLDGFHPINNRHGHRTGDRILLELARRLCAQLREIDLVARFGGDQFAVILPHTFEKAGLEVAERLRRTVASWVFLTAEGTELRLTASLGACLYPQDGATPPELVDAAQAALGFAKTMGGNQVQLYREAISPGKATGNVVPLPHSGRSAIVRSLAAAVDLRDGYTHQHSRLVSALATAIARRFGLPNTDVARIGEAALLHDVGKIGVPDAILTKEGSLTAEEWESIRQHPVLGKKIIQQFPELLDVMPLVLHHQEHYDGSGYPQRLRGENIPLGARIIAAADAYHAIRSHRPYRAGRTHQEAVQELKRCAGGQFDPQVVATLLDIMDKDEGLRALMPPDEPLTTPEARPHFPGTAAGEQTAASSPTRLSGRAAAHGPR